MDRASLVELVEAHGLVDRADEIVAAWLPAIALDDVGPASPEIGATRVGGVADLPSGVDWPHRDGRPLAAIAQIRLADVVAYDEEQLLPATGVLHFFWDLEEEPWGYDPAHAGGARVLHVASAAAREPPSGLDNVLLPRRLVASARPTVPPPDSLELDDAELSGYFALLAHLEREPAHQLLGHPGQIQDDMRVQCQLVTQGLYAGDSSGYDDPRRTQLEAGAAQWRLLLQIDSDEDGHGAMWGDGGRLYYWIRERDLRARRFDAAWLVFQCA